MSITRIARAIDPDTILDGCRTALLANGTVAGYIATRIYSYVAAQGATAPYVVLALPSVVYESNYNDPVVNALVDVSCYTEGDSTTVVRALTKACLGALIDTTWTVAGLTLLSANAEEGGTGIRDVTSVNNTILTRGKQFTIRVRAEKTS